MSEKLPEAPDEQEQEGGSDGGRAGGGPYAVVFAPDTLVLREARRLVADKNIRVDDLAVCCSQDPVIVIELLRVSNAMFFAGGRSPITSLKMAITRLGSDVVLDTLDKIKKRQLMEEGPVKKWFELHRNRCKRTAIIARLLAEALSRTLADECQAAGLFISVGDMLGVAYLREKYVELAEEHSRSGVNFRLNQDLKFDVEKVGINYLRRHGIPEVLLFAIDREGVPRSADRAIMKPICFASQEIVDYFDMGRWEKIAPGRNLPPKSALRMLQIQEAQYLKIYERATEYLTSAKLLDEGKARGEVPGSSSAGTPTSAQPSALQSEIQSILSTDNVASPTNAQPDDEDEPTEQPTRPPSRPLPPPPPVQAPQKDPFNLEGGRASRRDRARRPASHPVAGEPKAPEPKLHTPKATALVSSITSGFSKAQTAEELLTDLLKTLVDNGPFEKSALIVVSKDRKRALVVAARGPGIGNGQQLAIEDPLSPLAQCFAKVRSFSTRDNDCSPWGCRNYALSPIDADHDTPVALYADAGNDGAITFEGRRVFRQVVELLNQKLPELPGGIPVEV